jgi:hypothetical protein
MQISKSNFTEINSIGEIAYRVIKNDQTAHVMGITSHGIYLRTKKRWVIHITNDRFRSPITININPNQISLDGIKLNSKVTVDRGSLTLQDSGVAIQPKRDRIWKVPKPPTSILNISNRKEHFRVFAKEVESRKKDTGLAQILSNITGLEEYKNQPDDQWNNLYRHIFSFMKFAKASDQNQFVDLVSGILGAGNGLTPSGDDFIAGFLLMINRWRTLFGDIFNYFDLNNQVVNMAYQKTTSLSANMIEWSSIGMGEERTISAADWLVCGAGKPENIIPELIEFGNSSGIDTITGMAAALFITN